VGLFKPYERGEAAADKKTASESAEKKPAAAKVAETEPAAAEATEAPKKKARPTPTRAASEQARRERLNPTLNPKQAKARERELAAAKRGEELQKIDAEPRRVLCRNYVDTRRSPAGFALPIVMICLAASMFAENLGDTGVLIVMYTTWGIFLLIIIDLFLIWRGFKKLLAERLPKESPKGLASYAINRAINPRRLRTPKPVVKVGDKI
jgi:hypothetical protein